MVRSETQGYMVSGVIKGELELPASQETQGPHGHNGTEDERGEIGQPGKGERGIPQGLKEHRDKRATNDSESIFAKNKQLLFRSLIGILSPFILSPFCHRRSYIIYNIYSYA